MAGIIREIEKISDMLSTISDTRTKTLPFQLSPYQVFGVVLVYVLFSYIWGPRLMKNRQPLNVDKLILIYNAVQVIICAYVFGRGLYIWILNYQWFCQPLEPCDSPIAWEVIYFYYMYYFLKLFDLLDTVFFVLRKKFNQITFLHVYHHAGMVCLTYGALLLVPGGHGAFVGIVNCFVHCIMYSYYFLTIYNPEFKKYLWWKKHVTQLQIMQFFMFVVHMGSILFIPNCAYPKWTAVVFVPQNLFMLILFSDFYIKAYVRTPKVKNIENNQTPCVHGNENHVKVIADPNDGGMIKTRDTDNNLLYRNVQRS